MALDVDARNRVQDNRDAEAGGNMQTRTKPTIIAQNEPAMKEHNLKIDGVVEFPMNVDAKKFFDGLLDKIIDYVEAQGGSAGLSMAHKEYRDDDEEATDGRKAT
ncbi:MAG: hypothetical protein HY327_06890 [Chloroflexi bacterium]|nr:hypothetical protein [Chloroflexota bacterium]